METKPKRAAKPLTTDQAAILDKLKSSLAVLPCGPDGRPSYRHRKATISTATASLVQKGMNHFAARRVVQATASTVASQVSAV